MHTSIYADLVKMVASSAFTMAPVVDKSISGFLANRAAVVEFSKTNFPDDVRIVELELTVPWVSDQSHHRLLESPPNVPLTLSTAHSPNRIFDQFFQLVLSFFTLEVFPSCQLINPPPKLGICVT